MSASPAAYCAAFNPTVQLNQTALVSFCQSIKQWCHGGQVLQGADVEVSVS